jgi:malonate-semialdehyde dehydrogenase (acetylating)/methylmalonate-semialdehyde dehydrogenase
MATIATAEVKTDALQSLECVPHWIGGKAVTGEAKSFGGVFNPATGEVKRRVPLDATAELEQAVAAATAAFPEWSNMPALRRARVLFRFGEEHRPARRRPHLRARQGSR